MAAAPPHSRPGLVPGQQGYAGEGSHAVPLLEVVAERLWNAAGAGPQFGPTPVLGESHRLPDQTGKVDSFSGRERGLDQRAGRHLGVGGDVGDDAAGASEGVEPEQMGDDGALDRAAFGGGKCPPSAAHLLPDRCFSAVHPASTPNGDGRRRSVCQVTRSNCTARRADSGNTI